jgi:collagenase-like PrtC family protease
MRLILGPLLFHWPPDKMRDFYARIADEADLDGVVIGEAVCSKRLPLIAEALAEAAARLERAGKEVILASPILIAGPREEALAAALAKESRLIEAEDVAMLAFLQGRPHRIGPFVNVYNGATARHLLDRGAVRITLPPELPGAALSHIAAAVGGEALEVLAFGRLPLAISARCIEARLAGRRKDDCRFACAGAPDGRAVHTLEGAPFLAINGVQTLSFAYLNLITEVPALRAAGIGGLRLSPQDCDMVEVAALFRAVIEDRMDPAEGLARLEALLPERVFANGHFHGRAGAAFIAPSPGQA